MAETTISWCDYTFNPWRGCAKVSEGCRNCFAERRAKRFGEEESWSKTGARIKASGRVWREVPKWNAQAARNKTTYRVFVGSLLDIFEGRGDQLAQVARVWETIRANRFLEFLLLTKRPQNIQGLLPPDWNDWSNGYPNVWLGTSIESATAIDGKLRRPVVARARILSQVPAAVRFVSYEPALGPIADAIEPYMSSMDWLIAGGESGAGFRRDDDLWYREIRDLCRESSTAFFFKQHAAFRPESRIFLDGRKFEEFPVPRPSDHSSGWTEVNPRTVNPLPAGAAQMSLFS